jgi:hypothetical protein
MSLYIDSLIQNFRSSFALYFNKVPLKSVDGPTNCRRILIGGDVQLKALERFVGGIIGCHDSENRIWYFCNRPKDLVTTRAASRPTRLILPAAVREQFRQKTIVCYEYNDVSEKVQERLRSYLLPNLAVTTPGLAPSATLTDWINLAWNLEKTYRISETLDSDQIEPQPAILACCATLLEIGRASLEGRVPGYRNLDILSRRTVTSNLKYSINKAFERFTAVIIDTPFLTPTGTVIYAEVSLLSAKTPNNPRNW